MNFQSMASKLILKCLVARGYQLLKSGTQAMDLLYNFYKKVKKFAIELITSDKIKPMRNVTLVRSGEGVIYSGLIYVRGNDEQTKKNAIKSCDIFEKFHTNSNSKTRPNRPGSSLKHQVFRNSKVLSRK